MFILIAVTAINVNGAKEFKDSDIISTIETEFIFDPVVDFNTIDVECKEGVVTLRGNVNNLRAAQRVENIAEMLVGVKSVVNRLHVETPAVPDDSLESTVREAL